jgi:6-phosphogluconate dehydrogenase
VDDFIEQVHCRIWKRATILIDGGQQPLSDTIRRTQYVESKGQLYIGTALRAGKKAR